MKIFFQKKDFSIDKEFIKFSKSNHSAGSIVSFIGKVRPKKEKELITSIEIELYEKMALFQLQKIISKMKRNFNVLDFLIIHRFGKLLPGDNIVLILAASEHREQSFKFTQNVIDWLKIKVTFWKKENFVNYSKWVEQKKADLNIKES